MELESNCYAYFCLQYLILNCIFSIIDCLEDKGEDY